MKKLIALLLLSTALSAQSVLSDLETMRAIRTTPSNVDVIVEAMENTYTYADSIYIVYIIEHAEADPIYFNDERYDLDSVLVQERIGTVHYESPTGSVFRLFITYADGYWDEYLITRRSNLKHL